MTIQLLAGDCRDVLPTLAADSVHCVVTSPPYWNLRDYQTGTWDGGDAACDHVKAHFKPADYQCGRADNTGMKSCQSWRGGARNLTEPYGDVCGKCGARRIDRQIGLEATPDEYLATMVAVFREVRRVMRNDAVAFINMGDGYRDKQLLLMPARLALALQADGWWVRSDIIWHKPNPMPESCTDRPTSAHEHVFLLTKSARYFYDNDAIREPYNEASLGRYDTPLQGVVSGARKPGGDVDRRERDKGMMSPNSLGRSCRNVWTIATSPYSAAHFATFPPELAERCIRAGTSQAGCCAACGKPWVRTTEAAPDTRKPYSSAGANAPASRNDAYGLHKVLRDDGRGGDLATIQRTTTGWQPSCDHGAEVVPCRVLDCFAGAGTTLLVADRLQRDAIGIELNVDYTRMAMERCRADAPLFTSFPPAEPPEDERIADLFQDMAAE